MVPGDHDFSGDDIPDRGHFADAAQKASVFLALFGAVSVVDCVAGRDNNWYWYSPSVAVYIASLRGSLLGILAIALATTIFNCQSQISEKTYCKGCCRCCPDCARLSNAWHIRNVGVALLGFVLVAIPAPFSKGLSFTTREACTYVCNNPAWDQCGNCGLWPARRSKPDNGRSQRHGWRPGIEHECCPAYGRTEHVHRERTDECHPIYCVNEEFEQGCQAMCFCMKGELVKEKCEDHHIIAAYITGMGLLGVACVATVIIKAFNGFLALDGLEGRSMSLAIGGARYPPPMPRGAVQVVGSAGTVGFAGRQGLPTGAVVGTPVIDPTPSAAAAASEGSVVGGPVVVKPPKRLSEQE